MAYCVCKCLNVSLESDKVDQNVDIAKFDLASQEQRDIFLSEKLALCPASSLSTAVAQPALVGQRLVGRFEIHSCLACGQSTHAIMQGQPNVVLIPKSLLTTLERTNSLKKSTNFSLVFNLLIPELQGIMEMNENIDTNNMLASNKQLWPSAQLALGSLNKQLRHMLQSQLEAIEQSVQQFRDEKYAEFQSFKERAQQDHKILACIISKSRGNVDSDGWRMDTSVDNGPLSPQLPPLQRRRLSSLKDAKRIVHVKSSHNRSLPPEEDSLDAEDIFDLEGDSPHDMGSDQDDYDSDNSESHDEGIHIARARGPAPPPGADLARSLPINMPKFPQPRAERRDLDDDEETQDIAASIKALAKSVHGDVFELPRPRFSTQI